MSSHRAVDRPKAALLDLLMGVMDSLSVWTAAAGSRAAGLAWRDAVTREMATSRQYVSYEALVRRGAAGNGLPDGAVDRLIAAWPAMEPWADAAYLHGLRLPYAFVTNCSARLADVAARRSGLRPTFVLSAEEAGFYKPRPEVYRLACERIGAAPQGTVFVAGSGYDAEGARDAGLDAVFVRRRDDHEIPPGVRAVASMKEVVELVEVR